MVRLSGKRRVKSGRRGRGKERPLRPIGQGMQVDKETFRLTDPGKLAQIAMGIGVAGLLVSLIGATQDPKQFFQSYLTGFMFWLTIGLGGLFATMVHHLANVTWSVVVRRMFESAAANLPWMALFFLPIATPIGMEHLFKWTHYDPETASHLLQGKRSYLNETFFYVRAAIYFTVWLGLSRLLWRWSVQQDTEPSAELTWRMRALSGPGMVLFALTLTYAAFDWMMSLHYEWFSTMFGVYIFAGSFLSLICFTTLIVAHFHRHGQLKREITIEHYHDLGKWMFTFVVFWSYVNFSQYFLIWYANIPEETEWFKQRVAGNWIGITVLIVIGHFLTPFLILLSRIPKRSSKAMMIMGCWLLFFHWIDLFWVIGPNFMPGHFHFSWMDVTTFAGIGGFFVSLFWSRLTKVPVLPVKDPRLQASINFVNV